MKATVTVKKEIDVHAVRVSVPVRYGTEDMPADFPLRTGNTWAATILVDEGIIRDWPKGKTGSFSMKVVDQGNYELLDSDGNVLAALIGEYVPNQLLPGEYGDYLELDIDADGSITNWPSNPTVDEFFRPEE